MLRSRQRRRSSAASRAFQREQDSNNVEGSSISQCQPVETDASEAPLPGTSAAMSPSRSQVSSVDADMDNLTSTMSALKFVPPSVRFGRGGRRGGLARS